MEVNWQDRLRADTSDRARELVRLLDLTKSRDDLPEVARALGDVKQKRSKNKKGPAELRQDCLHSLQRKATALLTQALPGPAAAHSESNRARQPVERDPLELMLWMWMQQAFRKAAELVSRLIGAHRNLTPRHRRTAAVLFRRLLVVGHECQTAMA